MIHTLLRHIIDATLLCLHCADAMKLRVITYCCWYYIHAFGYGFPSRRSYTRAYTPPRWYYIITHCLFMLMPYITPYWYIQHVDCYITPLRIITLFSVAIYWALIRHIDYATLPLPPPCRHYAITPLATPYIAITTRLAIHSAITLRQLFISIIIISCWYSDYYYWYYYICCYIYYYIRFITCTQIGVIKRYYILHICFSSSSLLFIYTYIRHRRKSLQPSFLFLRHWYISFIYATYISELLSIITAPLFIFLPSLFVFIYAAAFIIITLFLRQPSIDATLLRHSWYGFHYASYIHYEARHYYCCASYFRYALFTYACLLILLQRHYADYFSRRHWYITKATLRWGHYFIIDIDCRHCRYMPQTLFSLLYALPPSLHYAIVFGFRQPYYYTYIILQILLAILYDIVAEETLWHILFTFLIRWLTRYATHAYSIRYCHYYYISWYAMTLLLLRLRDTLLLSLLRRLCYTFPHFLFSYDTLLPHDTLISYA